MKHIVYAETLPNGAKGLFIHVPGASVMSFEYNFRAGEYLVERNKWEAPHLMEHVLLGANERIQKARAFQAEFEKNGAYCNASTGSYDITYEAECADFEWDRIADLMLAAITKPLFLEDEFRAEFGNVREELTARSNNHFRHLSLALREAYGFKVMTDHERLLLMEHVDVEDIKQHYQRTHTTKNMRFVVAGNLTARRIKVLKALLSSIELPEGEGRMDLPHERPKHLNAPLYLHNTTVENLYFYIDTFMHRKLDEPELDALTLANTLLTETLHSNILGTAREKGLVYSMSSGLGQTRDATNWWFGAQIMPKNAAALFDIILKELHTVFGGGISQADITAAKQYSLGRYQRSGQTVGGTAAGYSGRFFFDDYVNDYYKIPERIEAITRETIVNTAQALFADQTYGMGVLGNAGMDFADGLYDKVLPLWQFQQNAVL